jgi:hypothetical protein
MVSDVTKDHFTLTLEAIWQDGAPVHQVRVIATNLATKSSTEIQLSLDNTHKILEQVYGGEPSIVEQQFEDLKAGHAIELLVAAKDPILFSPPQLINFGFNPDDLQATQHTPDR